MRIKPQKASTTAFNVQQGILLIAADPHYAGIVPEEVSAASRHMLASSEEGAMYLRHVENTWFQTLSPFIEYLLAPGLRLHYVLRKRFIEDTVQQALDAGVKQIVNLGAGLDTLLWRLHTRYPQACFIELDRQDISLIKRKAVTPTDNFYLLDIDFSKKNIADFLVQETCFDSTKPTLFISEGVLMYLDQSEVVNFFQSLRDLMNADARIIFTSLEPPDSPENTSRILLKLYLKTQKESIRWVIGRDKLADFLRTHQYTLEKTTHGALLGAHYLGSSRPQTYDRSEAITVAQIMRKT